jgi:hypothetical protein
MLAVLDFVKIFYYMVAALYIISHSYFILLFLVHKLLVFGDYKVAR